MFILEQVLNRFILIDQDRPQVILLQQVTSEKGEIEACVMGQFVSEGVVIMHQVSQNRRAGWQVLHRRILKTCSNIQKNVSISSP